MFEQIGSSPLFSIRRAIFAYCLAFVISLGDMWIIHLLGINTLTELLTQTFIHGTGFYLGYTIVVLFNKRLLMEVS